MFTCKIPSPYIIFCKVNTPQYIGPECTCMQNIRGSEPPKIYKKNNVEIDVFKLLHSLKIWFFLLVY